MNQRLRQLKTQAEFVGDRYALPDEFAEKFAELIVQECIEVVEKQKAKMSYGPSFVIQDIKQHFGEKE